MANALCVIPARGGSRRIPKKNLKLFHGKPIIAYSIEAAKASGLFDTIVVTTDDDQIGAIANEYGASWIYRPPAYAKDDVGTREVTKYTLETLEDAKLNSLVYREPFEYVATIYATSPLMSVDDLKRGYDFVRWPGVAHAISSGYPPLQDAAQFYWSKAEALKNDVEYFGSDTVLVPIATNRICDINVPEDFMRAEQMYEALEEAK